MAAILWAGLRQVQSLRDAIVFALSGNALPGIKTTDDLSQWLTGQGLHEVPGVSEPRPGENTQALMISTALLATFTNKLGYPLEGLARRKDSPDPAMDDFGSERSGAGWQNPANFIVTSAFVRLLGASEQFELDVLKALFYYRPSGEPHDAPEELTEVSPDVLLEQGRLEGEKLIFEKPSIWTWMRKLAENNVERDRIFSNVFGLKTVAPDCKASTKRDWYEMRNAIAHGRKGIEMTGGEYTDVEVFLVKSMMFLADQCRDKHRLVI